MEPQPTAVLAPIHLRIADDIRMRIERGDLAPGEPLPTLHELCEQWDCSMSSARSAVALLKQQGLITGGRGKAPVVRPQRAKVCRSSDRHQVEKDLVRAQEGKRRETGLAEIDMNASIDDFAFTTKYDMIRADHELAGALQVDESAEVLRRIYEMTDPRTRYRRSWSVSYIPKVLVESNPALLDEKNEPWPGGTQHQLYTVGIEIITVIDQVTAAMPTTAEARLWDLDNGVPLLRIRRISLDTHDRVVEISDADFPADRTELSFVTPLKPW
jgi:GntR family transcriptional regulator